MSDTSAILSLPYIQPSQAQKHVTHNEALRILDAVVQLVVVARDVATPPGLATLGDRYIVPLGATGVWAGQVHQIALYEETGWTFVSPQPGWRAEVLSDDTTVVYEAGSGWVGSGQRPFEADRVGINAEADTTNRLTVSSEAVLLNNAGAGHQVKINKNALGDTASLVMQTGYSGRAELGLAGNDDFSLKVSADGSTWFSSMVVDGASGGMSLPQGVTISGQVEGDAVMQSPMDITAGRLMRADYGYGPGNLLGAVSQAGGVPTGAVIEHGSNADGDYVKFADGTLICTSPSFTADATTAVGSLYCWAASQSWTFPEAFSSAPHVMAGGTDDATRSWGTAQTPTATAVSVNLMSAISATGCTARFVAVGRWY